MKADAGGTSPQRIPRWAIAILTLIFLAGLAAGLQLFWAHHRADQRANQLTMAVDYKELRALSPSLGKPLPSLLDTLHQDGVRTVLFKETTIDDLQDQVTIWSAGQLALKAAASANPASWLEDLARSSSAKSYLLTTDPSVEAQLDQAIPQRFPSAVVRHYDLQGQTLAVYGLPVPPGSLADLGFGFPYQAMKQAAEHGFTVIPQFREAPGLPASDLSTWLTSVKQYPLAAVFFNDANVTGYPQDLDTTASAIASLHVPLGIIESNPQKGIDYLAKHLGYNAVRLHSIPAPVIRTMTQQAVFNRYHLAATERTIRVLLLRVRPNGTAASRWQDLTQTAQALQASLSRSGLRMSGHPSVYQLSPPAGWQVLLMGTGVMAFLTLLLMWLLRPGVGAVLGLIAWLIWLVAWLALPQHWTVLLAALGTAVLFATSAVVLTCSREPRGWLRAILLHAAATLISVAGGIFIVAFLHQTRFVLELSMFLGTRESLALPPLLVLFLVALRYRTWRELLDKLLQIWRGPMRVSWLVIVFLLMGVGVIYITRSGNHPLLAPSHLELQVRAWLSQALVVRPRTKEFLVGQPALFLLLYYGYRSERWLLMALFAAIGQASITNTFSHIHTPVFTSLIRTFNGWWLGLLIGVVAVLVIEAWKHFMTTVTG